MDPQVEDAEQGRGVVDPERVVSTEQSRSIEPRVEGQLPKDNHWITILSMAVFVLLSLAAVVFLYYQNQQLKTTLASYQTQATPTPSATPDLTANWTTYTDPRGVYSFKYPSDWTKSKDTGLFDNPSLKFILDVETHESTLSAEVWTKTKECQTIITKTQTSSGCTESVTGPIANSLQYTFIAHYGAMHTIVKHEGAIFDISLSAREPDLNFDEIRGTYNQILSTFKFLGTASPSPAATQKACTLEAKLCPDGSSVGRTGPNCEFAPCP